MAVMHEAAKPEESQLAARLLLQRAQVQHATDPAALTGLLATPPSPSTGSTSSLVGGLPLSHQLPFLLCSGPLGFALS